MKPPVRVERVNDFAVRLVNSRDDIDTAYALSRLKAALQLVADHAPRRLRRMRRDLAGFLVQRFPCRGAFLADRRECLVELTFLVNPAHGVAEIAASIVHEATHARVAAMCGALPDGMRPREERLCRTAELELGLTLPDGAVVVERARAALAMTDGEVAPSVDWAEAARRVAQVDAARSRRG